MADVPLYRRRKELDPDEKFLETPELFDEVDKTIAKVLAIHKASSKRKNSGKPEVEVHRVYRQSDAPQGFRSCNGGLTSTANDPTKWRNTVAIAFDVSPDVSTDAGWEALSFGEHGAHTTSWLSVKFAIGTQMPHIILRVTSKVVVQKAVYVYIYANHLKRKQKNGIVPIRMRTGKAKGRDEYMDRVFHHFQDTQPELIKMLDNGKVTQTRLHFLDEEDDAYDRVGRPSRPIIAGDVTQDDLERFAREGLAGKDDQPENERLLGLLHANCIPRLDLFTPYHNQRAKFIKQRNESVNFIDYCESQTGWTKTFPSKKWSRHAERSRTGSQGVPLASPMIAFSLLSGLRASPSHFLRCILV